EEVSRTGYLTVPWNKQTHNTNESNFAWEADTREIITSSQGLYEVCLGFFTQKDPFVEVFVNDEVTLSSPRREKVQHQDKTRRKAVRFAMDDDTLTTAIGDRQGEEE